MNADECGEDESAVGEQDETCLVHGIDLEGDLASLLGGADPFAEGGGDETLRGDAAAFGDRLIGQRGDEEEVEEDELLAGPIVDGWGALDRGAQHNLRRRGWPPLE